MTDLPAEMDGNVPKAHREIGRVTNEIKATYSEMRAELKGRKPTEAQEKILLKLDRWEAALGEALLSLDMSPKRH